jgi:hypothetical protein
VGWATRAAVVAVGFLVGGWAPLLSPAAGVGAVVLLLRAVEFRHTLRGRPHFTEEIAALKKQGQQYEIFAHVLGVGALGLLAYGVAVTVGCIITAVLLP